MKILFLHISDMHISRKKDINSFHIKKIIDSLNAVGNFDHVIIIVSGDVAYTGKSEQYKFSWYLLGILINKLKQAYSIKSKPTVLVVPGNHDVDLSRDDIGRAKIEELYKNNQLDSVIKSECKKMRSFMNFAKGNHCFISGDPLYYRRKIDLEGFIIEANLLNSAALFTTLEEEKGLHYFPQYVMNMLSEPSGADFVISVMHHSPQWFNDENKAQLVKILFSKSSLLFFDHEHRLVVQDIKYSNSPNVQILAGGVLCNKGDWTKSEYFASILDTQNFMFTQYSFAWDSQEEYYRHKTMKSINLPPKPSKEKKLIPCEAYLKDFLQDVKHSITNDFSDYFVFPRLQSEERTEKSVTVEITDEKRFISELEDKKKMIIVGYDNSGTTTLLKYLFKILLENKVVLFFDIDNIKKGNFSRTVKRVFEDIYGDDPADYIRFQQMPRHKKVLIIDDVHKIKVKNFKSFIQEIENNFEYIIFSSKNVVELDIIERVKEVANNDGTYPRYRIMPFYLDKRNELIFKIVRIKLPNEDDEQSRIANILCDSLKKQYNIFNFTPDFIIQYTQYYCNNIRDITQNDGMVFSKVFEANIINAVMPFAKKIKVDKLFIVLDKVAYYIHVHKAYPIKQKELSHVIDNYNLEYGSDINIFDFIEITQAAKILIPCDNHEYRFSNKNYLAYFVAREINRRYQENSDTNDLKNIVDYLCFGINEDILLFLTYITDNANILRFILTISKGLTERWTEFDLNNVNIPYLKNIKPINIDAPTPEQKQLEEKHEIDREKSTDDSYYLDRIDIYDYKEEDINKLINQLICALSLLNIISRCLPNFEHMMRKVDKEQFVDTIFRLPNKIFYLWANEVENKKEELISLIKELQQDDYSRDKLTDENIIWLLQWSSMSLYLDLLNITAVNSTKENTQKYLEQFNYNSNITYSLQHLMILEQGEKISEFIKEASNIFDSSKNNICRTMIMRIVKHLIIHSRAIKFNEIQQLKDKYFPKKVEQKRLLIQRSKVVNDK